MFHLPVGTHQAICQLVQCIVIVFLPQSYSWFQVLLCVCCICSPLMSVRAHISCCVKWTKVRYTSAAFSDSVVSLLTSRCSLLSHPEDSLWGAIIREQHRSAGDSAVCSRVQRRKKAENWLINKAWERERAVWTGCLMRESKQTAAGGWLNTSKQECVAVTKV